MKLINKDILGNIHYPFPRNITYQPIFILITLIPLYILHKLKFDYTEYHYRYQLMKLREYSN